MTAFTKRFSKNGAIPFFIGVGISIIIFIGTLLISTLIIINGNDPTHSIDAAAFISLLVSSCLTGAVLGIFYGDERMKRTALVALFCAILMFLLGLVLFGGELSLRAMMNALCYFGLVNLSSFGISFIKGKRRKKRL